MRKHHKAHWTLQGILYFTSFVYVGFLFLLIGYLLKFKEPNLIQSGKEFTPVFIIAFCLLYVVFTCGEYFALGSTLSDPRIVTGAAERRFSNRLAHVSLWIFFLISMLFYYLRSGFQETTFDLGILIGGPILMAVLLIYSTFLLFRHEAITRWYRDLKMAILVLCALSTLIAQTFLFRIYPFSSPA